jgi:2TM domain
MNDEELREFARKRLKKQADFKQYLWVWLGVSILLTVIWFLSTPGGYFWPIWAIFGMGIGAFFTGIDAYSKNPKMITDKDVDAEVNRLKGNTDKKS